MKLGIGMAICGYPLDKGDRVESTHRQERHELQRNRAHGGRLEAFGLREDAIKGCFGGRMRGFVGHGFAFVTYTLVWKFERVK